MANQVVELDDNGVETGKTGIDNAMSYHELNAMINLWDTEGKMQLEKDKLAVRKYFLDHVNQNTVFFHSLKERLDYLVENEYYEKEILDQYRFEFIEELEKLAYSKKFRFDAFMGAYKFYTGYALKTFDGERYLERFEDRVVMVALALAEGKEDIAISMVEEIISGRFQPATPTFLNCGKKQRGEFVSCFLLRIEDNMESISRGINSALQLSKRGGGVALNLSNVREYGAPIKKIEGQSSGIIPVMKLLEDSFSYANQLGARQGAGAVYLNAHHPDILRFLDTKRENADEKTRIKTLSIGVVVPDITMHLAKDNEDMYLFSPYDVEKVYGVPFGDISVTEKYQEMVDDPRIKKQKIKARTLFERIAELQFESGYPYVMYEDTVNKANPIQGRINMSNLCSEILQVNTPTTYNADLSYDQIGKDISCNLGSLNIAMAMDGPDLAKTIETSIRALTAVSDQSDIVSVRSISDGNHKSHAIGLGQMNLHGYLAREHIHYGSEEALDFTNIYFYTVVYNAIKASNKIPLSVGQLSTTSRTQPTHLASTSRSTPPRFGSQPPRRSRNSLPSLVRRFRLRMTGRSSRSRSWSTVFTTRTCRLFHQPDQSPTSTTRPAPSTQLHLASRFARKESSAAFTTQPHSYRKTPGTTMTMLMTLVLTRSLTPTRWQPSTWTRVYH